MRKHGVGKWIRDGVLVLTLLGTTGLFIRSHYVPENDDFGPSPEGLTVWSSVGVFSADWLHGDLILYRSTPSAEAGWKFSFSAGDHFWSGNGLDDGPNFLGFRMFSAAWQEADGVRVKVNAAVLPLAPLAGILLAAIACRIVTMARGRLRQRANLCVMCGYDLRASPDRCPECGVPHPRSG